MMFRVALDDLFAAAKWVGQAIPARPLAPILHGIKIEVGESSVALTTFDFTTGASAVIPLVVREEDEERGPSALVVPGKLFLDMLSRLGSKTVDITVHASQAGILGGGAYYDLLTLPLEDFPALPPLPEVSGSLSAKVFQEALAQVSYATGDANDVNGVRIDAVRFEANATSIQLVTTDRYRVPHTIIPWVRPSGAGAVAANLPPAALALVKGAKGDIELRLPEGDSGKAGGLLGMTFSGRTVISAILEGEYPKWRRIVPHVDSPVVAEVEVATFRDALERAQVVLEGVKPVWLTFTPVGIQVEAGAGSTFFELVEAEVKGGEDGMVVTYNPNFIIDALKAAPSEIVRLHMYPETPGLLTAIGDDAYACVLVPQRVVTPQSVA